MKKTLILVGILAAALMAGCSDDSGSTSTSGSTGASGSGSTGTSGSGSSTGTSGSASTSGSSGSGSTTGNPAAPTLGSQIDRIGRPAINTAISDPFDADATAQGDLKDQYNSDATPSDWAATWTPHFASSLAILDGLDTNCGNQAFAAAALPDGGVPADRYSTLAGVLANDRLWLNTASSSCTVYLAVEANATGLIPNSDCGGRAPTYDVVDESYSILALGAPGGLTDGVDQSGHAAVSNADFPFLAAPR